MSNKTKVVVGVPVTVPASSSNIPLLHTFIAKPGVYKLHVAYVVNGPNNLTGFNFSASLGLSSFQFGDLVNDEYTDITFVNEAPIEVDFLASSSAAGATIVTPYFELTKLSV